MKQVEIGEAVQAGWKLYTKHLGFILGVSIAGGLLTCATCAILAGPLMVGTFMILSRLLKGSTPPPAFGDLFGGFGKFLDSFLLILVCGIALQVLNAVLMLIPILGWLAALLLGIVSGPILTWSLLLITHRGMTWTQAVGLTVKETFNGRFTTQILAGVVAGLLGLLGVLLCGFGMLLTFPLSFCIYAAAYEQAFGAEEGTEPPALPESAG